MGYVVEVVHLSKRPTEGLAPSATRFERREDADRHLRWAVGDLVLRAAEGFELLGATVADPARETDGIAASVRFGNAATGLRTEVVLRVVSP